MIDITQNLMNLYKQETGVVGRYSSSKIWSMLNGYLEPEDYLKGEKFDFVSAYRMWQGQTKHAQIQALLKGYEFEIKIESQMYDFVLVAKCDCINDEEILEIKTSDKVYSEAKKWHIYQLKLYLTIFQRDKGRIIQPIVKGQKLLLKELGSVERDDEWFLEEMVKLGEYHKKLLELIKK